MTTQSEQASDEADDGGLVFLEQDAVEIKYQNGDLVGYLLRGGSMIDMRARFLTKAQLLAIARRMD